MNSYVNICQVPKSASSQSTTSHFHLTSCSTPFFMSSCLWLRISFQVFWGSIYSASHSLFHHPNSIFFQPIGNSHWVSLRTDQYNQKCIRPRIKIWHSVILVDFFFPQLMARHLFGSSLVICDVKYKCNKIQ